MLAKAHKRGIVEGIVAFGLLLMLFAAFLLGHRFFGPPPPQPMPDSHRQASSRAAMYRMEAYGNPKFAAELREHGIDPATGYPYPQK